MSKTVSITRPYPIETDFQTNFAPAGSDGTQYARYAFFGCLLFIAGVSIYDTYLVAIFRDSILKDERNPICEILIRRDPDNLSWFMLGKALGNIGVIGSLLLMRWFGYRRTLVVAIGVAGFQLGLLTYLTISDPATGILHFDELFSPDPVKAGKAMNSAMLHLIVLTGMIVTGLITGIRLNNIRNTRCTEPATV